MSGRFAATAMQATERGCGEAQPQHTRKPRDPKPPVFLPSFHALRLVEDDTAALLGQRLSSEWNALPHPGLLPKEKETSSPPFGKISADWIRKASGRINRDATPPFPLPEGEG